MAAPAVIQAAQSSREESGVSGVSGCLLAATLLREEEGQSPSRSLRGLAEAGVKMLQPWQHLLLQKLQRVVPSLRLVLVIEAEHQKRAEAADLAPDLFDLFGHG